jgi:hypothetical protein
VGQVHNELRRGGLSAALTRAVGDMRGAGGLERYGETMTPVLDLWRQPEWAFLRGEALVSVGVGVNAVAAENGFAAIINPAGSGMLIVVEEAGIDAGGLAASTVLNVQGNTEAVIAATLTTVVTGNVRDTRNFATTGTYARGVIRTGTDAGAVGVSLESVRQPAGNMVYARVSVPNVLHPGFGFVIGLGTVNTAFTANFKWRERRAFPAELP